jgi:hypothetical protein
MDTHKSQSETTILFTNSVHLSIGEIGSECTANQELGSKGYHAGELVKTRNITKVNTTKIANIAIIC